MITLLKSEEFKNLLQKMMDQGEIQFSEKIIEESINVIIDAKFVGESSLGGPSFEDDLVW